MSEAYRGAGVDVDAAAKAVTLIADLAVRARRPEVADQLGGFAGLFRIGQGRLLAAATDGVGTKLEVARLAGRLDTVGIDLVAMCVDDVACTGAEPLFFLDYLATGKVVPERVAEVVEGIVTGCRRARCALLGGETAEHPGVMDEDAIDLAGFCVGLVEEDRLLGPHRVGEGDVLLGLPSSGLHANGYSLVRRTVLATHELSDTPEGLARPLVDELLEPCAIYATTVLELARDDELRAAAHITGGGFHENVPRALPEGLGAEIERGSWEEHPIFEVVRRAAGATDHDMFGTFNMGIGMMLVVAPDRADAVRERTAARAIGRVTRGSGVRIG